MQPMTPMILFGLFVLGVLQPAEGAVDFVLGMFADAAGVEQDRVGVVRAGGELVASVAQAGDDELAIEHVHLAADGFDVELHGEERENGSGRQGVLTDCFLVTPRLPISHSPHLVFRLLRVSVKVASRRGGRRLALDVGDEGIAPRLHQADQRHYGHVGSNGQHDEIGARHL